jgi:hypothetical protein
MATRIINAGVSLTDTNLTTVYTCPANYKAIVKEIWLTNVDGTNAVDATLKWTDDSDSDAAYSLLSTKSIAADSYLRIEGSNIVLESGDILKAQAGAANDLAVSVFIEEIYTP